MTYVPAMLTYSRVVTCETVCITLMLAALNLLEVMTADIMKAYFTAIWTTLGNEFRKDKGKKDIIVSALYSLKSASCAFCEMHHMDSFCQIPHYL